MTLLFRARRRPRALVLAAAAALLTGLAAPATSATAAGVPLPTVAGQVTDAVTGDPVEGAYVELRPTGEPTPGGDPAASSEADGSYLITAFEPGSYTVVVNGTTGRYVLASTPPFELAAAEQRTGVDLRLTPGATITGLALDATTGEPVVNACPSPYAGRTGGSIPGAYVECSDPEGRWAVRSIPSGPTTLFVGGSMTTAPIWAVAATSQSRATVYQAASGTTVDAGTLRLPPGGVITGRVTNRAGEPVEGTWVIADDGDCDPMCDEARTDANGDYRFENVRPGQRILRFAARPYAFQWNGGVADPASARRLRIGYGTTTTVDAVLQPEATLTVTVTGASDDEYVSANARTLSGASVGWGDSRRGAGPVTITGLPASRVKVQANASNDDGGLRTAWYGGTSVDDARPVRVAPDRPAAVTIALPG